MIKYPVFASDLHLEDQIGMVRWQKDSTLSRLCLYLDGLEWFLAEHPPKELRPDIMNMVIQRLSQIKIDLYSLLFKALFRPLLEAISDVTWASQRTELWLNVIQNTHPGGKILWMYKLVSVLQFAPFTPPTCKSMFINSTKQLRNEF